MTWLMAFEVNYPTGVTPQIADEFRNHGFRQSVDNARIWWQAREDAQLRWEASEVARERARIQGEVAEMLMAGAQLADTQLLPSDVHLVPVP